MYTGRAAIWQPFNMPENHFRSHVAILDFYLSKVPPEAILKHIHEPGCDTDKIAKGEFIDLHLCWLTSFAQLHHHQPRARPSKWRQPSQGATPLIKSLNTWLEAFLRFVAIRTQRWPDEIGPLLAYADTICDFAATYNWRQWVDYDTAFRTAKARDPNKRWDEIENNLWATKVEAPLCGKCLQRGHTALQCSQPRNPTASGTHTSGQQHTNVICRKFNEKRCRANAVTSTSAAPQVVGAITQRLTALKQLGQAAPPTHNRQQPATLTTSHIVKATSYESLIGFEE